MDKLSAELDMPFIISQPPDTFTAPQYAKRYKLNVSSARLRIMKLKQAGKVELIGRGLNNANFYHIVKK